MNTVVKIQMPIVGGSEALVYDEARKLQFQMPIDDNLIKWMRGEFKKFFEINFITDPEVTDGGQMVIHKELPDQGW